MILTFPGKHGDTGAGEIDVLDNLREGTCDVGFVSKLMLDRRELTTPGNNKLDLKNMINVPLFDHCQFDCLSTLSIKKQQSFQNTLFSMDWNKPEDQIVMKAEGLRLKWQRPRESGYETVYAAISKEKNIINPLPIHTYTSNPFKSLSIVS